MAMAPLQRSSKRTAARLTRRRHAGSRGEWKFGRLPITFLACGLLCALFLYVHSEHFPRTKSLREGQSTSHRHTTADDADQDDFSDSDEYLRGILSSTRSIALVGASPNPGRPSNHVMKYLMQFYEVFPVNPLYEGTVVHGRTVLASLADVPQQIDMVDIFRKSADAASVVDDAIAVGAKTVWMQVGVINEEAALKARTAGLNVVMDRCPRIMIPHLFLSQRPF